MLVLILSIVHYNLFLASKRDFKNAIKFIKIIRISLTNCSFPVGRASNNYIIISTSTIGHRSFNFRAFFIANFAIVYWSTYVIHQISVNPSLSFLANSIGKLLIRTENLLRSIDQNYDLKTCKRSIILVEWKFFEWFFIYMLQRTITFFL